MWPELVRDISIAFAAWTAIYGIDAWRREHRGVREMELAEDTLAVFYEARDAIRSIRNPMGHSGEGKSRKPQEHETPEEKDARDKAYAVSERYERHKETFAKLLAARYRFMAQFGKEAAKPFFVFNDVLHEISVAAHMLSIIWAERHLPFDEEYLQNESKERRRYEQIIWYMGHIDTIEPKIDGAVEQMEQTCRQTMESRGTLFGLINLPAKRTKP